jgi:hypothetical protein
VGVINDGGIGIQYLVGDCWTEFQPDNLLKPVLSLEVFPMLFCFLTEGEAEKPLQEGQS